MIVEESQQKIKAYDNKKYERNTPGGLITLLHQMVGKRQGYASLTSGSWYRERSGKRSRYELAATERQALGGGTRTSAHKMAQPARVSADRAVRSPVPER